LSHWPLRDTIWCPIRNADGIVSDAGPEDDRVTREALDFFLESDMQKLRAKALQDVYEAFEAGELQEWWDVEKLFDDFEGGDDGEHGEGYEIDAPVVADASGSSHGSDAGDSDGDDDGDDDGDGPGGGGGHSARNNATVPADQSVVPVAAERDEATAERLPTDESIVPVAAESEEATAERLAKTISNYDVAINMSMKLDDRLAASYLKMRKTEAWKLLRRRDPETELVLKDYLAKDWARIAETRQQVREADVERRKKQAALKEMQAAKAEEQVRKMAEAKRKAELDEMALKLPRTWKHVDFGQGCDKLTAKHISNIRSVLARLRLQLPLDDVHAAQWPYFVEMAPQYFLLRWGPAIGIGFATAVKEVIDRGKDHPGELQRFMAEVLKRTKGDLVI